MHSDTSVQRDALQAGVKYDDLKIPLDLVSPEFIYSVASVLKFGEEKYERYNWAKGINYNRLYRGAIGHIMDWWAREDLDPESGLDHLSHAACCLMFLIHYELHKIEYAQYDNRPNCYDSALGS